MSDDQAVEALFAILWTLAAWRIGCGSPLALSLAVFGGWVHPGQIDMNIPQ
jgi:hypothetical protein